VQVASIQPPTAPERSIGAVLPTITGGVTFMMLTIFLLICADLQLHSTLHHDPAWLIHGTEVFLDGGKLYRDVFELNPPLIFYLTVPPVWLARQFHLFDIDTFVVYVFGLIALSLWASWLALSKDEALPPWIRTFTLLAAAIAVAICPAGNFGQREHLMIVFSLPYLLLAAGRARSLFRDRCLAFNIGVFSAFGFALKPHFLLIPFALECYIILRTGTLTRIIRAETIGLGAMTLLYAAVIAWFTPDYLTTIVPFGVAVYGGGFDSTLLAVLACPATLLLPLVLALHIVLRRNLRVPEFADTLCVAAVCSFIIYVVQMKGWSYQAYPVDATLFLGLAALLLRMPDTPRPSYFTVVISVLLLAMGLNNGVRRYQNEFMAEMASLVEALPPDSSIYVFTAKVSEAFPLVNYTGVGWSSRFDTFWLLPGLVTQPNPSHEIEQFVRDAVVADLTRQPPTLVFIDVAKRKAYFGDHDFDYISYFSTDSRFTAIWEHYQPITQIGHFLVFRRHAPGVRS